MHTIYLSELGRLHAYALIQDLEGTGGTLADFTNYSKIIAIRYSVLHLMIISGESRARLSPEASSICSLFTNDGNR